MFPHRSDWNGYEPASGWFFVAGDLSRAFDALAVSTPLILQTRGVDTLQALRAAGGSVRTFGAAIEMLAAQPQLLAFMPEAWGVALMADARSHTVSPESMRAILYAAWVAPRQPSGSTTRVEADSVTLPVDTILPSYGDDLFQVSYAEPTNLLSVAPYRASWLGSPTALSTGARAGRSVGRTVMDIFVIPPIGLAGRVLGRIA